MDGGMRVMFVMISLTLQKNNSVLGFPFVYSHFHSDVTAVRSWQ